MVVQNISANGKETDLTFTIKTEDLNKQKIIQQIKKSIIENCCLKGTLQKSL